MGSELLDFPTFTFSGVVLCFSPANTYSHSLLTLNKNFFAKFVRIFTKEDRKRRWRKGYGEKVKKFFGLSLASKAWKGYGEEFLVLLTKAVCLSRRARNDVREKRWRCCWRRRFLCRAKHDMELHCSFFNQWGEAIPPLGLGWLDIVFEGCNSKIDGGCKTLEVWRFFLLALGCALVFKTPKIFIFFPFELDDSWF